MPLTGRRCRQRASFQRMFARCVARTRPLSTYVVERATENAAKRSGRVRKGPKRSGEVRKGPESPKRFGEVPRGPEGAEKVRSGSEQQEGIVAHVPANGPLPQAR